MKISKKLKKKKKKRLTVMFVLSSFSGSLNIFRAEHNSSASAPALYEAIMIKSVFKRGQQHLPGKQLLRL